MKKYQQQITVYEFHDGFRVELFESASLAEYYLVHKDYGIKTLMFGIDAPNESLLLDSIDAHIKAYKDDFFSEV